MKVKIGIIKPIPITSRIDFIINKTIAIETFFLSFAFKISRVFFIKFFRTKSQIKFIIN